MAFGTRSPEAFVAALGNSSAKRLPSSKARTMGRAAGGLDSIKARALGTIQPICCISVKSLPHADEAGASASGIEHGVGQFPVKLLGEFVPEGFLSLHAEGFLERGHVEPALGGLALGDLHSAIGDEAVDQRHVSAGLAALDDVGLRRIGRHEDMGSMPARAA